MSVILTISSQVVRGHVGNSAAVFALQQLGHDVWPLVTTTLAHHPGHGREVPQLVTPAEHLYRFVEALDQRGWLGQIDAVSTGYFAQEEQVRAAANILTLIKSVRPDALFLCDPVIGDSGGLYVTRDIAQNIHNLLVPTADILTPNLFEIGWLTNGAPATLKDIISQAASLGPAECLVSSAPSTGQNSVRTILVNPPEAYSVYTPLISSTVHGAGDLLAALYLGWRLMGESPSASLAKSMGGLNAVIEKTGKSGANELALIQMRDALRTLYPATVTTEHD